MVETRYFVLKEGGPNGRETCVFTGKSPRQAALKAASRGYTDIYLRERGNKYKVHHFKGSREKVRAPANKPEWMAAFVNKPNVRKVGLVKFDKKKKKGKAKKAKKRRR